jgi:predicted NBD/HSP70 family sugar kinase
VPGLTNDEDASVSLAPQLGWRSEPLAAELQAATGLPVRAANDAHLGLLAETNFGGSSHVGSAIYLNGGANRIGGGIISGGHPVKGSRGYAGELGHFRIRSGGERDSAGLQGTLESEVNRDALVESLGLDRRDFHRLDEVLAGRRTPLAQAEIDRQIEALGTARGTMVTIFNPDLILLGGFLGSLLEAEPVRLRNVIARETLAPQLSAVRILRPTLGSEILLIGAAELAFQPLLSDPGSIRWPVWERQEDVSGDVAETQ